MSRFLALVSLLLLAVAIAMATASVVVPSQNEAVSLENKAVQMFTDVVSGGEIDETRAITPYGYRSLMLQNVPGRKLDCWRCGSPCSAYACCNDGYPQCCLVGGVCRCCRG